MSISLKNQHIDKVAQQNYYYNLPEEFIQKARQLEESQQLDQQYLEDFFSELEDIISISFKNINNNKAMNVNNILKSSIGDIIDRQEQLQMSKFIALQSIRTPSYRILGEKFFELMKEILPKEYGSIFDNNLDENAALYLHLKSGVLERLATHFSENFQWSIASIENPEQAKYEKVKKTFVTDEFLISDNPIINVKHMNKRAPYRVALEFGFPLNSKHMIILRDNNVKEIYPEIFSIDRNQVRIYNEYQYRFSNRKIFYTIKENEKKIDRFFKRFPRGYTHNQDSFCVIEY